MCKIKLIHFTIQNQNLNIFQFYHALTSVGAGLTTSTQRLTLSASTEIPGGLVTRERQRTKKSCQAHGLLLSRQGRRQRKQQKMVMQKGSKGVCRGFLSHAAAKQDLSGTFEEPLRGPQLEDGCDGRPLGVQVDHGYKPGQIKCPLFI